MTVGAPGVLCRWCEPTACGGAGGSLTAVVTVAGAGVSPLVPTAYLVALRDLLKASEPELWSFFAASGRREDVAAEARQELLRSAYRLDRVAHAPLVDAAEVAAERLGVTDPVTLYQAQDGAAGGANAGVISLPGEAHIVFSGQLLDLVEDVELVAVVGHEMAHHVLWTLEGGDFWVLDRLVHASASDMAAKPCHEETARLLRLHTELVADRGAVIAVGGDVGPAVSALVKISTGLRAVSGEAYLEQAREVVSAQTEASGGHSHPELFLRAWALDRWCEHGTPSETEVGERIAGPVDLDRLDLLAQRRTESAVVAVLRRFLAHPWAATDAVLAHVRLFDEAAVPERRARKSTVMPAPLDPCPEGLTDLLAYVLLDLATVDEEIAEPALAATFGLSDELGIAKRFDALVAKELDQTAKDVKTRRAGAASVLAEAGS
jgi:Zn-dependent protease with chaperone function